MKNRDQNRQLVYTTESGRLCPTCERPIAECKCQKTERSGSGGDGIVRIRREVKGHAGKTVTTVTGLALSEAGLKALATELKRQCGTGGTVKDGIILIQGDHRNTLLALLEKKGYKVKLAGG